MVTHGELCELPAVLELSERMKPASLFVLSISRLAYVCNRIHGRIHRNPIPK
jgi:hypothetical protein